MFTENICGKYNRISKTTSKQILERFEKSCSEEDKRPEKEVVVLFTKRYLFGVVKEPKLSIS